MEIGARRNVQPGQCLLAFSGLFLFLSIQFLGVGLGLLPQWGEHIIYTRWAAFPFAIRYGSYRLSGVLFLDELPEFSKDALEVLRQPLEDHTVTITRAAATLTYPCNFMLVCAMNPCRCGYFGHPTRECTCSASSVSNYRSRISGPLLDRIDLHVEVPPVTFEALNDKRPAQSSAEMAAAVRLARQMQQQRYANEPFSFNAQLPPARLSHYCPLEEQASAALQAAFDRLNLSARAYDRIVKVARTIADLEQCETISRAHVLEAISYRSLDRKYWQK